MGEIGGEGGGGGRGGGDLGTWSGVTSYLLETYLPGDTPLT